jgi:uncharacterized protein YndB with AHSA1/START domain
VPKVTRARTIAASPGRVWDVVSDPAHLPRWWPDVVRVEDATSLAWTKVLSTGKGKTVRADYTRTAADEPRHIVWRQELEESPFERILSESTTEIDLEPDGDCDTRVRLQTVQRLRGMSRLGGFMFRRATGQKLEQALDGLERAVGERGR